VTEAEMDKITSGMKAKAEKVRALNAAGVSTSDISRYLKIRYQHVYNVLLRSGAITKAVPEAENLEIVTALTDASGNIILPKHLRERYGIVPGEPVFLQVGETGLTLIGRATALRQIMQSAQEKMPDQAALIEALLSSRPSGG